MTDFRTETNSLGPRQLPREAVWGIHTARASRTSRSPACRSGTSPSSSGRSPWSSRRRRAPTASSACSTPRQGRRRSTRPATRSSAARYHEQFVVDVIQGGAGTSTNMNANEVIANSRSSSWAAPRATTTRCTRTTTSTARSRPTMSIRPRSARGHPRHRAARPRRSRSLPTRSQRKAVEFARHAQDGPHPAAGRGADDARPGVRRLPRHGGGGHRAAPRDGRACSAR